MKFPWSHKPKKSAKKSPSKKQELDNAKLDVEIQDIGQKQETDKIIHQKLKDAIDNDPALYRGLIQKKYDIKLAPPLSVEEQLLQDAMRDDPEFREEYKAALLAEKRDAGKTSAEEMIEEAISEQLIETVGKNPQLLNSIVQKRISRLAGGSSGGSFGNIVSELEALEELKERLGGGNKSPLAGLLTPEVLAAAFGFLGQITGKQLPQTTRTIRVLNENNEIVEITEEQWKQIEEQRRQIPQSTQVIEEGIPGEELGDKPLTGLNPREILDYLDEDPDAFVALLHTKKAGNLQLQFFWDAIKGSDVDSLMEFISSIDDVGFKPIVERLSTPEGQEWLSVVVKLVKEWKE